MLLHCTVAQRQTSSCVRCCKLFIFSAFLLQKEREGGWMTSQFFIYFFLPLSLPFPFPFPLSSVVEDGGLSVGDGMVRDGWRRFGGIGGGGS